ncbi:hypothetical protein [Flavobacterium sp.]|uniref:hypothetical protein n=1 Tax=Flavobacterium sp. TaxID=239 RepID=UPI003D11D328
MKIFPKSKYSIELNSDSISAISELKKQTLSNEKFVTNWNGQVFIGKIKESEFEIKLSKKLLGEICILSGKLQNKEGALEIRTGGIFKIIFVVMLLFGLSGIITAIIQNKLETMFQLFITILLMRFIILELGFQFISKCTLKSLTEIIGIKKIEHLK